MAEMHRIEIEIDDEAYARLQGEAQELGLKPEEVIARAIAAWFTDMDESSVIVNEPDPAAS